MQILEKLPSSTNECRIVDQEEECPEQRMKVSVTDSMAEVQSLDKSEQIRNCSHRADHFDSRIFEKYGDSDEIRLISSLSPYLNIVSFYLMLVLNLFLSIVCLFGGIVIQDFWTTFLKFKNDVRVLFFMLLFKLELCRYFLNLDGYLPVNHLCIARRLCLFKNILDGRATDYVPDPETLIFQIQ